MKLKKGKNPYYCIDLDDSKSVNKQIYYRLIGKKDILIKLNFTDNQKPKTKKIKKQKKYGYANMAIIENCFFKSYVDKKSIVFDNGKLRIYHSMIINSTIMPSEKDSSLSIEDSFIKSSNILYDTTTIHSSQISNLKTELFNCGVSGFFETNIIPDIDTNSDNRSILKNSHITNSTILKATNRSAIIEITNARLDESSIGGNVTIKGYDDKVILSNANVYNSKVRVIGENVNISLYDCYLNKGCEIIAKSKSMALYFIKAPLPIVIDDSMRYVSFEKIIDGEAFSLQAGFTKDNELIVCLKDELVITYDQFFELLTNDEGIIERDEERDKLGKTFLNIIREEFLKS